MARLTLLSILLAVVSCGGATSTGPRNYDVVVEGSHSHFIGGGPVPDGIDAGVVATAPADAGGVQVVVPTGDAGRVVTGSLDGGRFDAGGAIMPIPGGPIGGALGAGLDATHVVVTRERLATAALERVPFQVWPAVPGHVEGLLYASGPQPWGSAYEHTRALATSPERTEYKFGFDRSSPFAEYFVSDGRGYNFLRGWNPSGPPHDAAMFLPTTPNSFGLSHPAHVVALEANDGQGAAANNVHFVVTGVRVLDGTAAVPMDPTAALTALRHRADHTVDMLGRNEVVRMGQEMGAARGRGGAVTGVPTTTTGMWPTWIQADHTLEVLFVSTTTQTATFPSQVQQVPCPPCPCARGPGGRMVCAPCVACNPTERTVTPTTSWGWEVAILDRVDASGRLLTERIAGPREL